MQQVDLETLAAGLSVKQSPLLYYMICTSRWRDGLLTVQLVQVEQVSIAKTSAAWSPCTSVQQQNYDSLHLNEIDCVSDS